MSTRSRFEVAASAGRGGAHADTFFGRFPASYWQRWTSVTEVVFRARVRCRPHRSGGDGLQGPRAHDGQHDGRRRDARLRWPFPWPPRSSSTAARCSSVFTTTSSELSVQDAEWTVAAPEKSASHLGGDLHVQSRRRLRQHCCGDGRRPDCAARVDDVYVIDQGTDQVQTRQQVPDAWRPSSVDKLVYISPGQPRRCGRISPAACTRPGSAPRTGT